MFQMSGIVFLFEILEGDELFVCSGCYSSHI